MLVQSGGFAAETKIVTDGGLIEVWELEGKQKHVLSKQGIFRPVVFKSFGVCELYRVEFISYEGEEEILVSGNHLWWVQSKSDPTQCEIVKTVDLSDRMIPLASLPFKYVPHVESHFRDQVQKNLFSFPVVSVEIEDRESVVFDCQEPESQSFAIGEGCFLALSR